MYIAICVVLLAIFFLVLTPSKPYTHDEWEKKCKEDFKKYGPVPDNKK